MIYAFAFYVWNLVAVFTLGWGLVLPRRRVLPLARWWAWGHLWAMRATIGLRYRVEGLENLPEGPVLIASKHQSAWETIAFNVIFDRPAFVLKRELFRIPVIGWWLWRAGQQEIWQRYQSRPQFLRPTYGLTVWDTDIMGLLSQCFHIQGEGYSVGGASASGAVAIIHAARQIVTGATDISIALGSIFDISGYECHGLANLGAMGSERFADRPDLACRPFDQDHDGFIYGEGCGVLVLERSDHAQQRGAVSYGKLMGWGFNLDGNRSPEPSQKGEERAMNTALAMAELQPEEISYVNTHGTSSPLGDRTEVAVLKSVGLNNCLVNSTKSLTGHCLTGAGVVEAIATLLQMNYGFCHPTHNLVNPIDTTLSWVKETAIQAEIKYAISNSFAFGGINTALLIGKL
ncbi:MAG: polyketide beta-ketoacyl:ACP synthase [Okeania sp. SIO3B3]|nr:polyketide beta-ketoacyl:ACP synthase [Okeania sp. SIO3B3]